MIDFFAYKGYCKELKFTWGGFPMSFSPPLRINLMGARCILPKIKFSLPRFSAP